MPLCDDSLNKHWRILSYTSQCFSLERAELQYCYNIYVTTHINNQRPQKDDFHYKKFVNKISKLKQRLLLYICS